MSPVDEGFEDEEQGGVSPIDGHDGSTHDDAGSGGREAIAGAGPEGGQEPRPTPGRNGARAANGAGHEGGRGVRDQIRRYRTAFASVVAMILIAAFTGGYILTHERLAVPSWFPVIGHSHFKLKAEFQTAQAVTPGQGQSVTIAGAKIGEIESVTLHEGRALVTMSLEPKYARYIYRDATMLLRPKTQLKDETVEIDPGRPVTGRLQGGDIVPISQTAPDINLDQFLASLDAETRAYLQLLLAGASQGLQGNSRNLSAAFKRFDPLARESEKITRLLSLRHADIARAIHNFKLLIEGLGSRDKALSELVDSANAALGTFAQHDHEVQLTLHELPEVLRQTNQGLGKLATAAGVAGPALTKLQPFAKALGPALQQTRPFLHATTPIIKNEIRPFTREIEPVVSEIKPDLQDLSEAFPGLSTSFSVLNEFLNELAYNPGANQPGFLFYLNWFNHNANSVFSSADAGGPIGNGMLFLACPQLFALHGAEEVNPTVQALSGLLHLPKSTIGKCPAPSGGGIGSPAELSGRVFGKSLESTFGLGGTP
jgi:phospholipid/cholesterol/gamma-HCH transport system substrate-binding protein